MQLKIFQFTLLGLLATTFLVGCVFIGRSYNGPPLPRDTIAVLVKKQSEYVDFFRVDGKTRMASQWDKSNKIQPNDLLLVKAFNEIELMPGEHTIQIGYVRHNNPSHPLSGGDILSEKDVIIKFNADRGHVYQVKSNFDLNNKTWKPEIVDITNQYSLDK